MKTKLFFAALIMSGVFVVGCSSDNRTPIEKANELLSRRSLPMAFTLDSVFDYADAYNVKLAGYNLQWHADSVLMYHQQTRTAFELKEKEEALQMAKTAYELKTQAALMTLKHDIAQDRKEFVGFSTTMADSVSGSLMTIHFDKEVTNISAIDSELYNNE